jgi:hypothetical protein
MSIFWFVYLLSACTTAGIFTLLARRDIREGKVLKVTLPEGLLCAALMFVPYLNAFVAACFCWYYISEHGAEHSITFGKGKDPK